MAQAFRSQHAAIVAGWDSLSAENARLKAALYFTERDANNCRAIAESWPIERPEEMQAAMRSLADRIEALLPPEDFGQVGDMQPSTKDVPQERIDAIHDYLRQKHPLPPEK